MDVIARGNHKHGYSGVIVDGILSLKQKTILTCEHKHKTTVEARECAKEILDRIYLEDEQEV